MRKQRRYFQWIDGENKGEVETLETIEDFEGEIIYNFVGGESCNQRYISKMTESVTDLKGKFMVEVENPHNICLQVTGKAKFISHMSGLLTMDYQQKWFKMQRLLLAQALQLIHLNGNKRIN
jgi:hypothetical protein